jgi:large subunit ribosomal protein L6
LWGSVAANIRKQRGPEPYKGKGIRYKKKKSGKKREKTGKKIMDKFIIKAEAIF